ncbi:hypothetical protein [Nonomuraea sp. NPDC050783]|uniref:hypothetical protein n=1 Tax=Nonomuraea sp. NPDC050783 TaxID=3154634 RepID=UPI00346755B3
MDAIVDVGFGISHKIRVRPVSGDGDAGGGRRSPCCGVLGTTHARTVSIEPFAHEKIIKFNELPANCVIYSTARDITDAANAIAAEGRPVDPDDPVL